MNDLSLDELAKLSLGELAAKFRQRGDTCALASMMFSVAMLFRDTSYISGPILRDIELIFTEENAYQVLRHKVFPEGIVKERSREPILIEHISKYLSLNGYNERYYPATRDNVVENIRDNPVIALSFPCGPLQWKKFFGSGTSHDWWAGHVICAVGTDLEDGLLYFEPLAGEMRKKNLSGFNKIYGGEVAVITPSKN